MSSIVATFDPSTASSQQFAAPNSSANGALVFFNESNISLQLQFTDGSNMYLPAWYHRHKCGPTGSVNIDWTVHQVLASDSPPISQVIVESFATGEKFPADGPLVRQTNLGNTIPVSTSTSSIVNTGNAPGTSIISATPNDAASATWSADNAGNVTIKSDNAGVLTTLFQLIAGASPAVKLAAAAIVTEILGDLKLDGKINSALIRNPGGGAGLQLGTSSQGDVLDQTAGDIYIKALSGALNFQSPNGTTRWTRSRESLFSGTGSGTFNHGLGVTPDIVVPNPATGGGSQTIGFSSANNTSVVVTTGAGLAWSALAIKL